MIDHGLGVATTKTDWRGVALERKSHHVRRWGTEVSAESIHALRRRSAGDGPLTIHPIAPEGEQPACEIRKMVNCLIALLVLSGLSGVGPGSGEEPSVENVEQPAGGQIPPAPEERYDRPNTQGWNRDALVWNASPIDLSFLNAKDRPTGRHGVLKADGDKFIFEDGSPVRFWGANLVASALFSTPHENVAPQARRMAQLGFNLIRVHQLDAPWAEPNIFAGNGRKDTRHLDPKSLDRLDWWIKCLEDEGIYIWLDIMWNRVLTPGDGVSDGFNEIKKYGGNVYGFSYINKDVIRLMEEFQRQLVTHVNRYTRLAYKDDPAIVGVLITNENDFTHHFANPMLPAHKNLTHSKIYMDLAKSFAKQTGLPEDRIWRNWEPGPGKIFVNAIQHRFDEHMIEVLRSLGVRAPLATTNFWGECPLSSLPALCEGDLIDVHSYGNPEALSTNPRDVPNFLTWIGAAQIQGKPLSITEWTVTYPGVDRFTAPLYLASIASLQGWDMPMIFNYSHQAIRAPGRTELESTMGSWCTFSDPALCGVMPAAAVAFRQGHVSPARTNYCLMLNRTQLVDQDINPRTSATIRTLIEQSRFTVGLPAIKELPWLKPTKTPSDATIVTDPNHDFIPKGQSFVRSDTGEVLRSWKYGIQTIDTPKTQAVSGWIGGKTLRLSDATIRVDTHKCVVALTSIDEEPLANSRSILITAVARAFLSSPNHLPFFSEPVTGTIVLRSKTSGLELLALGPNGKVVNRLKPLVGPDGLTIQLPAGQTHWYLLASAPTTQESKSPSQSSH